MAMTAGFAAKMLRAILTDYNFWPQSESDSPLSIKRGKLPFDEAAILSRDASMRRAAIKAMNPTAPTYKAPAGRRIEVGTIHALFQPLIKAALEEVAALVPGFQGDGSQPLPNNVLFGVSAPIELAEYLTELYQVFAQMTNPQVIKVYDQDGDNTSPDAYTTMMICAESVDGEIVIAQALLIQT